MKAHRFSGVWGMILCLLLPSLFYAQSNEELLNQIRSLNQKIEDLSYAFDVVIKNIDDVLWYHKVGDVAYIDKVYLWGPPRWKEPNPTAQGAGNPLKFWTYVFIPRNIDPSSKYPLIVLPHGGVHADFSTYYTHIVRELIVQGYVIVAPDYRGSTGYGKKHHQSIDYGGLEIEDVKASRDYMVENYPFVDSRRVGIVGWSHGGLIALMNIFEYPEAYQACFAGVPVSDLIARMGYKNDEYRSLFSADYHIGQTAEENVNEYRRRSPVWNVHKMKDTPLLIHTTTNDDDVNVLEVEHLIRALKAEGKKFEYEIFENHPAGHSLDRMDTRSSNELRLKIHQFLARHLKPPSPFKNLREMRKAAYFF